MIAVLSPAKSMREESFDIELSEPRFKKDAARLVTQLKKMDVSDLMRLMDISEKLAILNHDRFRKFSREKRYPAGWLMDGDVYTGLNVDAFDKADIAYADGHIRILSGLYGLLGLRDAIAPYRLEMSTKLKTDKGKNLYEYWGHRVRKELLKNPAADLIVNLASHEYHRVLGLDTIKAPVLQVEFKELRQDGAVTIPIYSKIARGHMAHFMVKSKADVKEDLKAFAAEGYSFNEELSNDWNYIFTRRS